MLSAVAGSWTKGTLCPVGGIVLRFRLHQAWSAQWFRDTVVCWQCFCSYRSTNHFYCKNSTDFSKSKPYGRYYSDYIRLYIFRLDVSVSHKRFYLYYSALKSVTLEVWKYFIVLKTTFHGFWLFSVCFIYYCVFCLLSNCVSSTESCLLHWNCWAIVSVFPSFYFYWASVFIKI